MKLDVFGRDVEVRWAHIFVVLAVIFGLTLIFGILAVAFAIALALLNSDSGSPQAFNENLVLLTSIFVVIITPLYAFLFLTVAERFFKLKRDVALCRSLAGAEFIIGIFLWLLSIPVLYFAGYYSSDIAYALSRILGGLLGSIAGAVILYLWLLVFIKLDKPKIIKSLELALVFTALYIFAFEFFKVLISYQSGNVYDASSLFNNLFSSLSEIAIVFLFGFVMLYHIQGKKIGVEEYMFAGFYLAPMIITITLGYLSIYALGGITGSNYFSLNYSKYLALLAKEAIELALLAVLAKVKI